MILTVNIDYFKKIGFGVLTAVSTEMAVFWVVAPCSLVDARMMEAVNFYQTTRRYNPKDSHLSDYFLKQH
jgi:hypothetical protein